MNWGTELWDQYDNLASHTHKGIEILDKYGTFVKERCAIELEYAGKLRRLVKNYQPKRKEEEENKYTSCEAFKLLLRELDDYAGQRELVAENLQSHVVRELHLLAKELREERKQHLNEGAKQMAILNASKASLDRARRGYDRAARESERALESFQKADADLNMSRADVEKHKAHMKIRSQACEDAKQEYTDQLRKTNEAQQQHYEQRMPHVFKQLQDLDEKRIKNIKNFMLCSVDVERKVFPIIMKCLDGMEQAANSINEKEDTKQVIEKYKSGFAPPADIPMEARGAGAGGDAPDGPRAAHHLTAARGTYSGPKIKKRSVLLSIFGTNKNNMSVDGKEDYSDLPPNQKKKKLQAKVSELNKQLGQEQAAMDALMKMKSVYESNPSLGNPMTVEGQLTECYDKIKKLRSQLNRFEGLLTEASSELCAPAVNPAARTNGAAHQATSIGSNSESLSRSASESSVSTGAGAGAGARAAGGSPESGLGGELAAAHHDHRDHRDHHEDHHDDHHHDDDHHENEHPDDDHDLNYYYEPDLQPLGYCIALYNFDAHGTGSTMRMEAGERLLVLERDAGDGWTRVRRLLNREEGFVPTTYIATTTPYSDIHHQPQTQHKFPDIEF